MNDTTDQKQHQDQNDNTHNQNGNSGGPEQHRVEIPKEVIEQIQKNAEDRTNNYLGESVIGDLLIKFYNRDIRFYMKQDLTEGQTPVADQEEKGIVTEHIVQGGEQYKLSFNMNRVGAKQLARHIKGFSITPFNL